MGWANNYFMENTKKLIVSLFVFISLFSCGNKENKEVIISKIKSPDLIVKTDRGYVLQLRDFNSVKNDFYSVNKLRDLENKLVEIQNVIDFESFENLTNSDEYKNQIKNDYYLRSPIYNYFFDKNYVYIYSYLNGKNDFYISGFKKDLKILGGAYIRVKDTIYCYGDVMKGVDVTTFKTIDVMRNKSEWDATFGLDNYNIYRGGEVLLEEDAVRFYLKDSIKNKYFHNRER